MGLRLLVLTTVLFVATGPRAWAEGPDPAFAADVARLLGAADDGLLEGGLRIGEIAGSRGSNQARVRLEDAATGEPAGGVRLRLRFDGEARLGGPSTTFRVVGHGPRPAPSPVRRQRDEAAFARVLALAPTVMARDDGATFGERGMADPKRTPVHVTGGFALLGVWALVLAGVRRPWTWRFATRFRWNHFLPSGLQLVLFAYWAVYVQEVRVHLPLVALQVAWAVGFDALLSLSREGRWTASFAPLPIVLSTNLFVWFGQELAFPLAIVAIALLSKAFLRRGGRHVFNPSGLGIVVVVLATYLVPGWEYRAPGHEFNLPPHMAELILLLGLLPQRRFPIVLVTLPAFATLWMTEGSPILDLSPPPAAWPTVLLVLVLFATDPMTMPRTQPGKVLYGVLMGLGIGVVSLAFDLAGLPDAVAKVVPIPFLNAATPWIDRLASGTDPRRWWIVPALPFLVLAAALPGWHGLSAWGSGSGWWLAAIAAAVPLVLVVAERGLARRAREAAAAFRDRVHGLLDVRHNRWHVAAWVALAAAGIAGHKPALFEMFAHVHERTPLVQVDEDGLPRCARNAPFCQAFRPDLELRAWLGAEGDGRNHWGQVLRQADARAVDVGPAAP